MKKTMTLNLSAGEMETVENLCVRYDLSKTAVIKKALRLFTLLDARVLEGERIFLEGGDNSKIQVVIL